MDCHFLFQGIFPTRGLNLGLLHCRQMLYRLSHQKGRGKRPIGAVIPISTDTTLCSAGWIPGLGVKIPQALQPRNQNINNRSNIVTNSIKAFTIVSIKKKIKRKIVRNNSFKQQYFSVVSLMFSHFPLSTSQNKNLKVSLTPFERRHVGCVHCRRPGST